MTGTNGRQGLVEMEIAPDKELLLWTRYLEFHRRPHPLFQLINNLAFDIKM
jgi:hypothetical protein